MDPLAIRRELLAQKKSKLEELRKLTKQASERVVSATEAEPIVASIDAAAAPDQFAKYLDTLLATPAPKVSALNVLAPTPAPGVVSRDSTPTSESSDAAAASQATVSAVSPAPTLTVVHDVYKQVNVPSVDVYEVGIQTEVVMDDTSDTRSLFSSPGPTPNRARARSGSPVLSPTMQEEKEDDLQPSAVPTITEAEVAQEMIKQEFQAFLMHSTKLMHRVLGQAEQFDVLADMDADVTVNENKAEISESMVLSDDLTAGRCVNSIQWSPSGSDRLVAAYDGRVTNKRLGSKFSEGLVTIWSLTGRSIESTFTCQSSVLNAVFHPFETHLVFGSTYSGQIMLWDSRQPRQAPAQWSTSSERAHAHPVFSLAIRGSSSNAQSMYTISTDGRMCTWNTQQINDPITSINLTYKVGDEAIPPAVSCVSFPGSDANLVTVGCETGDVVSGPVHGAQRGNLKALDSSAHGSDLTCTHAGPVTAVHYHPSAPEFLLSSSMDWSCQLYYRLKPIHVFTAWDDYVYDVAWSPTHPTVFGCVDGTGQLSVWNLNHPANIEAPVAVTQVSSTCALNKMAWSLDGRRIAVGASDGSIPVLDLAADLAAPKPGESPSSIYESFKSAIDSEA